MLSSPVKWSWCGGRCLVAFFVLIPFLAVILRLSGIGPSFHYEQRALIEVNRSIEFGAVDLLSTIDCHFPITNNSREPLVIKDTRAQCHCQNVYHQRLDGKREPAQKVIIAPGTSETFGIVFVATGRLGEAARFQLSLYTDIPTEPEIAVSLNYTPSARLYCVPQSVVLGDIGIDQKVTSSIDIYADGRQNVIDWSSITTNKERYAIQFNKNGTEPIQKLGGSDAAKIGQLDVTFLGGKEPENFDDDLIVFSEGKECFHVKIQGRIMPGIVASPAKVSLPRQSGNGPTYSAVVAVRTHPQMPFELQISNRNPQLHVKLGREGLQSVHILNIEYQDPSSIVDKNLASIELIAICPDGNRQCKLDIEFSPITYGP